MGELIIRVEGISKKFHIGQKRLKYRTLRDSLMKMFLAPARRVGKLLRGQATGASELNEIIWALKDVSFGVKEGEVVGIIGRNGAGKSTLLKILSRITEPTAGFAEIKGRVGSLLEVGTGFHPELTGRDNIYLNAAILGMRRAEIESKFDEIVAFSDVEKFIDTPVKHYSSGMYLRLAFAVAAHLEPEILIVDVVLAVGDAQFQKKCLGKMEEVGKEGRTVLFVSHNMAAIERLCQNTLILKEGENEFIGPSEIGIAQYLQSGMGLVKEIVWDKKRLPGDSVVKIQKAFAHTENNEICDTFDITKKIGITIQYDVFEENNIFTHGINVFNEQGINVFNSHDVVSIIRLSPREKGTYNSTVWIPQNFLAEGIFFIGVAIFKPGPFILHAHSINALSFKVIDNIMGNSARGNYTAGFPGVIRPLLNWETKKASHNETKD
jgi:lipopolysaccharide transport system ATP-binding protein